MSMTSETVRSFAEGRLIQCVDCGAQSDDPSDFHMDGTAGPECTLAFIRREQEWRAVADDPFWLI